MMRRSEIIHGHPPSPPSMIKGDPHVCSAFPHEQILGDKLDEWRPKKTVVRGSSGRRKQHKKRTRRRRRGVQKGGGHFGIGRVVGAMAKAAVKPMAKKAASFGRNCEANRQDDSEGCCEGCCDSRWCASHHQSTKENVGIKEGWIPMTFTDEG